MGPMAAWVDPFTGLITVTGAAEIYETEPGVQHVWSLRVYPYPKGELLREHHYTETVLILPPGQATARPEFRDTFPLPPGQHTVKLSLYSLGAEERRGFDWRRVKPGEDLHRRFGMVSGMARVAVR
jgi:hypothetical protein